MTEQFKAYVDEDWQRNLVTIQVREATQSGSTITLGVMEDDPLGGPPILARRAIEDFPRDAVSSTEGPRPGFRVTVAAAEAILVALLAWSSSTPGDNPVERAQRAEGERDLALAEVAQLRYDLAVMEGERTTWESLALQKDDTILSHRDHLADVRRAWDHAAAPPIQVDLSPGVLGERDPD
jgi:hypothetical protein